jgi:hypothetical protein
LWRRKGANFPWALAVLGALELSLSLRGIVWSVPSKVTDAGWPPFLRIIEQEAGSPSLENFPRFLNLSQDAQVPELLNQLAGLRSMPEKLTVQEFLTLPMNTVSLFHFGTPLGSSTLHDPRHEKFWETLSYPDPRLPLSLLGTNYLGTMSPRAGFQVLTNHDALPLLFVPSSVAAAGNEEQALRNMEVPSWPWRSTIMVEGHFSPPAQRPADLTVQVGRRTYNELEATVRWNESFDSHWTARFEDKDLPLQRANYWASAVLLPISGPQGEARLQLAYRNPYVTLGRISFLLWFLFSVWILRRPIQGGRIQRSPDRAA